MCGARWSRGHWLTFIARLARDMLGFCRVEWSAARLPGGQEGVVIHAASSRVTIGVGADRPDETWESEVRERLRTLSHGKMPDLEETCTEPDEPSP